MRGEKAKEYDSHSQESYVHKFYSTTTFYLDIILEALIGREEEILYLSSDKGSVRLR